MQKLVYLLPIVLLACMGNSTEDGSRSVIDSSKIRADIKKAETGKFWTSYTVPEGHESMKQLRQYAGETPQQLVDNLNAHYPEIQLVFMKTEDSTIYVKIPASAKLSSGSGSAGATDYMATAVYTLTELPKIKYVYFEFPEGDHARPGLYSRQNFVKF